MKVYPELFCQVKRITLELYDSKEESQNNLHNKKHDATIKILLIQKAINPTANSNAQISLNCGNLSQQDRNSSKNVSKNNRNMRVPYYSLLPSEAG